MHWPLSNYLFFIGMLLSVLLFLPVYLYFYNKETDEPLKNFLYIIFFLVCLSGIGAIMAVKPSNNILIDAIRVNNAIDLDDYYHLKKEFVKNYSKAVPSDLEEKTITLLRTINDLKTELIIKSSKQNSKVIKGNHKILLWKIWNLENQDVARTSAFRGKVDQLMQEIEEFQHFLISIPAIKDCGSVDFINELLPVEFRNYRNVLDSHSYYYDTRLIMTILQLTEIENNIRLAESEAISILNSQQVM
jgi:hypothetical protein